jgi:hypothetical protein
MVEVIVLIGFFVLAIACLSLFGLFGIVVWLVIYGLFYYGGRALIRFVGDEDDSDRPTHHRPHP